ncbi:hypothetical protein DIE23_02445 [Burkholderia sp. Bp9143]|uniref:hypothetical protein n=1 Tax=Burkholderia sp. Bp9143 TaxID=2184574 RepID=UPI000F597CC2|nr:hypothetical protein [Burkholderia sp. Bp9143]RQR39430.1 hypothetical protein DIE23_02445 [Burkholderia sp. Bp9143]
MASITNRSRFFVSVRQRDDLHREFSFHRLTDAKAYHTELVAQKLKPRLGQYEDTIEIRIRQKGWPTVNYTAGSIAEAEKTVQKIEEERSRGLFRDYTKAHQVTFVDLIRPFDTKFSTVRMETPRIWATSCLFSGMKAAVLILQFPSSDDGQVKRARFISQVLSKTMSKHCTESAAAASGAG